MAVNELQYSALSEYSFLTHKNTPRREGRGVRVTYVK
jgi:hypothetical protein